MERDNDKSPGVEQESNVIDASTAGVAFGLAAGFFAGLVWVGSKLTGDYEARKTPEATTPGLSTVAIQTLYVHVIVKRDRITDFIAATRASRDASRGESDCFKYDIYQSTLDDTKFVLHEVYRHPGGAEEHKNTIHYKRWALTVSPMMACDRRRLNAMPSDYTRVT